MSPPRPIPLPLPACRHAGWTRDGGLVAAAAGGLVLVDPRDPTVVRRLSSRPELESVEGLAVPGPGASVYALVKTGERLPTLVRIDRAMPELWEEIATQVSAVVASPAGERCAFAAPSTNELYLQDGDSGLIRRVGTGVPLAFSADGEQLLAASSARDPHAPFVLYRTGPGSRRELTGTQTPARCTPRGFGFRQHIPCALEGDEGLLFLVDLDSGARTELDSEVTTDSATIGTNGLIVFWQRPAAENTARLMRVATTGPEARELARAREPGALFPSPDGRWVVHSGEEGSFAVAAA